MGALAELTTPQLTEQLAFLTALEKVVKERKGDVRFEVDQRIRQLNDETGVDSLAMHIGGTKVGKVSMTEPKPTVSDPERFGVWAAQYGMAKTFLTVEIPAGFNDDDQDALIAKLHEAGLSHYWFDHKADDHAKDMLTAQGNAVVDKDTGEIVPGTYLKPGYTRVTGCKPEKVGEAMSAIGSDLTVAGFLEGEA